LYGRNTTGGPQINHPTADLFGVNGEAKIATADQRHRVSTVKSPIVDNRVALNLAGQYSKDDGFGRDVSNGQICRT